MLKRHKNDLKVGAADSCICTFLRLFDSQLESLITFEGINIV